MRGIDVSENNGNVNWEAVASKCQVFLGNSFDCR